MVRENQLNFKLSSENPEYYSISINNEPIKLKYYKTFSEQKINLVGSKNILTIRREPYFFKQPKWKWKLLKYISLSLIAGYYEDIFTKEGTKNYQLSLEMQNVNCGQLEIVLDNEMKDKFKVISNGIQIKEIINKIEVDEVTEKRLLKYQRIFKTISRALLLGVGILVILLVIIKNK